jgi:hypothetical protein
MRDAADVVVCAWVVMMYRVGAVETWSNRRLWWRASPPVPVLTTMRPWR